MSRLIVCSEVDLPSVNMRAALLSSGGWEDIGHTDDAVYRARGDDVLMSIPGIHIHREGLDREAEAFGIRVDSVVVMSKHSAKSGQPALTVHPIGNYHEADFGGRARTLVPSDPAAMSDALRRIRRLSTDPGVQVCYEATHHGPYLEKPTYYIEIGSDPTHWGDTRSAELLARVIGEVDPHDGYRRLVGIGGSHYTSRFTEAALGYRVDFGHMIPNYQLEGRDDEDIARMIRDACRATDTDSVYIHRKSMKGPQAHRIADIASSAGFDVARSDSFEPLDANRRRSPRTPLRGWPCGAVRGSCRRSWRCRCGIPPRS